MIKKTIKKRKRIRILKENFATFMGDDGKIYHAFSWKKGDKKLVPVRQAKKFIMEGRAEEVKNKKLIQKRN